MDRDQERRLLIQKLSWARAEIVRVAAVWQAEGHNTTPLTQPVVQIQEALATLEASAKSSQSAGGGGDRFPVDAQCVGSSGPLPHNDSSPFRMMLTLAARH